MSDTSKTAKIIKRWYHSTAHWQLDDVMVSDITFFMIFAVFDVSLIACRRLQVDKLMFCTFIVR